MTGSADELARKLNDAIAKVLYHWDGSLPDRWMFICETLEKDASKNVFDISNEGLSSWEALGMLEYGAQVIKARAIAAEIKEGNSNDD